jgi:hypothetical protein
MKNAYLDELFETRIYLFFFNIGHYDWTVSTRSGTPVILMNSYFREKQESVITDHSGRARSNAWTVFVRLNARIVGYNPTQDMDVCIVCVYSVFMLFCV